MIRVDGVNTFGMKVRFMQGEFSRSFRTPYCIKRLVLGVWVIPFSGLL